MDYTSTFDKEELYREYDSIISTTMVNLFSLSKETKDIIFNSFNYKNRVDRVFLESAFVLSSLHNKKIGLNMPFLPFLYFKYIVLRKRKNNVFRVKEKTGNGINIKDVAIFEAKAFNRTLCVFDDIYNSYYKNIYRKV